MKILIVTQYYYPEQFQINEIAPELVRRGHEVTVLTGLPNYPAGDIYPGYEDAYKKPEIIDGVRVIRCKARPRRRGVINLVRNYLSYAYKATRLAKRMKEKFDLVLSYELSPITSVLPAKVYARKNKTPHIMYCLDLWPESAQAQIGNKKSLTYRMVAWLSRSIYRSCDRIAVTSRPFIDYIRDVNRVDESKLVYIPQHADTKLLGVDMHAEDNGIADFMYAGNMGKGQTLDVLVRAVAELGGRNDFVVHMVGDGSKRAEIEALAESLGVKDKFIFYGNQKREDMPAFYKKADALILTLRGNNAVGNTMPGKLQVYMTAGKPIFAAINGAANEVIREADCGSCVAAGDHMGLAKIMADYIDNPAKYSFAGENAKKYFANNFTLEHYMDRLESEMNETVKIYQSSKQRKANNKGRAEE